MATLLIVPGLGGSGPAHWQSRWECDDSSWLSSLARAESTTRFDRVVQRSWDEPVLSEWRETLERAVQAAPEPVLLVAHSLGAVLVAHWAQSGSVSRVKGALLVAPPDVEAPERVPEVVRSFAPVPRARLPFPSIVVASRDDVYACIERARELGLAWGARFVDVGQRGHINAESNLGTWPEGRALLAELL